MFLTGSFTSIPNPVLALQQGLNLAVQPGARNPADPAAAGGGGGRLQGGAEAAVGGAVAAGSGSGGMANEGRWTDNGQQPMPMPMLDQMEQAIVARLRPSQAAAPAEGAAAGARDAPAAGRPGEGAAAAGGGGGAGEVRPRGSRLLIVVAGFWYVLEVLFFGVAVCCLYANDN